MEEFVISKYRKIYIHNDKLYIFNVPKFIQAVSEGTHYSTSQLAAKLELVADDELGKKRMASRIQSFLRGNNEILGISAIHLLGLAFKKDENAFLEEVPLETITQALKKFENSNSVNFLKGIYSMLHQILSEVLESSYYNFIPGTHKDGLLYYEKRIDSVRTEISVSFLDKKETEKKLLQIADETEIFVKSYSLPGVVKRWENINKQISFFDSVYDFYEEYRELYNKILQSSISVFDDIKISFSFIPTKNDINERKNYFAEIAKTNSDNNLQYSYEKIYRNELLNTLRKVFEHDFPELKSEHDVF